MIRRLRPGRWLAPALALALAAAAHAADSSPALEQAPASFRSWVESLPEPQRQHALRRLETMPPFRRGRLYQRWDALDAGQRQQLQQRMLERLERFERGERPPPTPLEPQSPDANQKLAPLVRRWRDMGPMERRRMRMRLERFGTLAPADQQALIDKRFPNRPPEERAHILESLREASKALAEHPLLETPGAPPDAPPGAPPGPAFAPPPPSRPPPRPPRD